MPEILRFRATWGFAPGPNFDTFKEWFPELKVQGYGKTLSSSSRITLTVLASWCGNQLGASLWAPAKIARIKADL